MLKRWRTLIKLSIGLLKLSRPQCRMPMLKAQREKVIKNSLILQNRSKRRGNTAPGEGRLMLGRVFFWVAESRRPLASEALRKRPELPTCLAVLGRKGKRA